MFPARLLTITSCLGSTTPEYWNNAWTDYGVEAERIHELQAWVVEHFDIHIGLPNVFFSLELALQFVHQFFPFDPEIVILGCGLHHDVVPDFLVTNDQSRPGERVEGMSTMLRTGRPLAAGGELLGFEVLGKEYASLHSWVCDWVYREIVEEGYSKFGVRPNRYGLLPSFAEAAQYAAYGNTFGFEGVDNWWPWLIVQYPV